MFCSVILLIGCILPGGLADQKSLITSLTLRERNPRDSGAAPTVKSGGVVDRGEAAGRCGVAAAEVDDAKVGAADVDVEHGVSSREGCWETVHPGVQ